jgi:hypothetical protein
VVTLEGEAQVFPAAAVAVRAAADASGGAVARLAEADVPIVYVFDTSSPMAGPTLLSRYTSPSACSLAVLVDDQPAGALAWAATGARWDFATLPLTVGTLEAGPHRLTLRGCADAELDMLVLARDSSRR